MSIIETAKAVIMNTYNRYDLVFERGEGCWLYTDEGKKILDFSSGVAVSCLGHNHPALVKAVKKQVDQLIHVSNLYYSAANTRLAQKLCELSVFKQAFFCNSGAEANEAAVKLARKYGHMTGNPEKHQIITMKGSFHGRTLAMISASGQEKIQKNFSPLLQGFQYVTLNDAESIKKVISQKTAAVLIEPILGESGIIPAQQDYLMLLRELCDQNNALLIFDEIQTGIGRTGKLFAYQHFYPLQPDAITIAKGLAGGFPIGALLVQEKISHVFQPGDHGSTFGGNLICSEAALAVLETISNENLLAHVEQISQYLFERLMVLKNKYPAIIRIIRGRGLLVGLEPSFSNTELISKLLQKNIIAVPAGNNIVRFMPPLIVKEAEIDLLITALQEIFAA